MAQSLENKVVLITGASSGIGAATAKALAELGCKLALAARREDRLEVLASSLPTETLCLKTDVTNAEDVTQMVDQTVAHFGRIDVLFANAGLYLPGKAAEGDPDAWAQLIDVNVNGVLRSVRAVLPQMIAQKSGDILVTSSISGFVDIHWEPVYSASKHAVQSFVHTLRRQVAPHNIRVGAVAPGMVANELWGFEDPSEIDEKVREHASLTSEDVAEAVVFMLSRPPHVTIRDLVLVPQQQDT